MISFLNQGWVGIVFGLIVSFYFYRKSERLPDPRVTFISNHALTWDKNDKLPSKVEIRYDGVPVQRISRSLVRIWNAGNGCLSKDLVPEHDRVRLHLPTGGEFLRASILKQTNPSSLCNVTIDSQNPSDAYVTFEYLNKNDGMVIGLLHTDSCPTPELKGSMKGHQFKVTEEPPRRVLTGHRKWLSPTIRIWLPLALGVLTIALGLIPDEMRHQFQAWINNSESACTNKELGNLSRVFIEVVGFSYVLLAFRGYWVQRRTYPKSLSISKNNKTDTHSNAPT